MNLFLALMTASEAAKLKGVTELSFGALPEGFCPGQELQIELNVTDSKGKGQIVKPGPKVPVSLTWEIGSVSDRGALAIPDPRAAWGKDGTLVAASTENPSVRAEVKLPMRYDCSVVLDFSGRAGDYGERGSDGESVAEGKGMDGRRGSAGQDGGDAPEVQIRATLLPEPKSGVPVLQVEVATFGGKDPSYAVVDPLAGEIVVKVNGGEGGQGGQGGSAGAGSAGGGRPGDGGDGGQGGDGGAVTVFVDETAASVLRAIVVENAGGPGGPGGRGGQRVGNSPGDAANGNTGREGQEGQSGPPPAVQPAKVGALW